MNIKAHDPALAILLGVLIVGLVGVVGLFVYHGYRNPETIPMAVGLFGGIVGIWAVGELALNLIDRHDES